MSLRIILDTALLAVPNYASDEHEAEGVIFSLQHWADFLREFGGDFVFRSVQMDEVLGQYNYLPVVDQIRNMLELVGLSGVYSPEDVWKSYNTILVRSRILIDEIGFEVQSVNDAVADPDAFFERAPTFLVECSKALMATSILAACDVKKPFAVASAIPHQSVSFGGTVVDVVKGSERDIVVPPVDFRGTVSFIECLPDILRYLDPLEIWGGATSPSDFYIAILSRIWQIELGSGVDVDKLSRPKFVIGSGFIDSLYANGAGPGGQFGSVLLETCARLLLGDPKNEVASFGGGDRVRDGAQPKRTHVTKGKVGLRLMLWRRRDGLLELANVGPKNELSILSGTVEGQFRLN